MNKEDFQEALIEELRNTLPENCSMDIISTTKNNDVSKTGIVIRLEDSALSPTVYVDDLYRNYQHGETLGEIRDYVLQILGERPQALDPKKILSKESILENVVFKMRNTENNRSYLENVPVKMIDGMDDIALVPYLQLNLDSIGNTGSVVVHDDMLKVAGISKEELFEAATENSENSHITIKRMSEIIGMMFDTEETDECMFVAMDGEMKGISPLACRDFFEMVKTKTGTDRFMILPSSVHELIIIKQDMAPDREMLFDLVRSVNSTMREEEVLSYNIYECDKENIKTYSAEAGIERYAEM